MNIVFFSRLFYPHVGGVEKHVLEISKLLIKKNYKITVITEKYNDLPTYDKFEGIEIIRIYPGKSERFKKIVIWIKLLKYVPLMWNAKIIHCHDIFFWYLPFRFFFPFKNVYTTFHGYEANEIPNSKSIFMHKVAEKFSKGNICIGNFFKNWYGTKPNIVAFGAVDKKLIDTRLENKVFKKDAMFLGRLEEETGIMRYLEAVKELKISLDIYGNGNQEKKVREYIKNNKLNVELKGFVFNATDFIKDYKYVFTSRYLGILEAMALRKPIFSEYDNTIKKDYLEMTPFSKYISISSNSTGIVKEFNKYIEGKSNIDVNKEYEWVKNKTWEKMVDTYLSLWEEGR